VTEPLIFTGGAAADAFYAVAGAWVAFEGVMNVRQRWRAGHRGLGLGGLGLRSLGFRDPSYVVVVGCFAASVIAAVQLGAHGGVPWPGGRLWPVIAGIAAIVAGIGLRAWSIAALGRFFQYQIEIQPGHRVVTTGPYRYVRHPSYTAIALGLVGIALASGDVFSLLAVAVLGGLGLAVRIRAEERQLAEALGDEYERFAAHRKRLIPGVW
jgi:protein-S-isoprenylcysteine O-methyltransferase Ste14